MFKKDILAKLKVIPSTITTLDDIINYLFEKEVKPEKITYQAFRSMRLKEMANDTITYKEKLGIISIEWKKY